jgi:hypothetical protein
LLSQNCLAALPPTQLNKYLINNIFRNNHQRSLNNSRISSFQIDKPTFLIETGNYEMKDGAKSLLGKRDGEWKLYRDIGNTSMQATK